MLQQAEPGRKALVDYKLAGPQDLVVDRAQHVRLNRGSDRDAGLVVGRRCRRRGDRHRAGVADVRPSSRSGIGVKVSVR